ncbi:MAG: hypothetical protein GY925_26355 [Actinomycetia bacterium]|nr:hypothetical protein [Actinomycetes bacterium]
MPWEKDQRPRKQRAEGPPPPQSSPEELRVAFTELGLLDSAFGDDGFNEVDAYAGELFESQRERFDGHRAAGIENRRVPTWDECKAKSQEIRRIREVDATSDNALI